ncbi:methyltransferase, partial [Nocardioides sp. SYSU DS0663]|uniref:methyltransferase n=1 Tax=Nocardioides sp. SYSU DS0663 TaxID=3416445 RepID=UPI003F4C1B8B
VGRVVWGEAPRPAARAARGRRAAGGAPPPPPQQGDLSSLLEVTGPDAADVVLCHGVLEVVADPVAALATLRSVLRPGGTLSLLAGQRHAAVVARAMAGHFAQALALLDDVSPPTASGGRQGRRYTATELTDHLGAAGFEVVAVHGVRVFADLVPGSLLELEPGAATALVELEQAVAERPEYLPLATQLHVLAR